MVINPLFPETCRKPCQQINCTRSSLALTRIWSRGHCKASPSFSLNKGMLGDLQTTVSGTILPDSQHQHSVMNRFLNQLHWIEFSHIWHITSRFSAFPQLLHVTPQTDTTKCPLSLHDCCMATIGTTPARQLWEKFQTLVPSPCKNSTWELTKIRTSRWIIDKVMKDYLFFPHRDKDHGNMCHASNKRICQLERT